MNLLHAVATDALIAELKRRKLVRVVTATTTFFNDHADDTAYMHYVDCALVSRAGAELHNELCVTFKDEAAFWDEAGRPTKTIRTASLMALVPEGTDDVG